MRAIPPTKLRAGRGGFTLIEMVIVILILGIVSSVAAPLIHSTLSESKLQTAVDQVVAAVEFAQLTALSTGMPTRVTMDPAAETVLVERGAYAADFVTGGDSLSEADVENMSFSAMSHPIQPTKTMSLDLTTEAQLAGVDLVSASFGGDGIVIFDSSGAPSDGGTFTLAFRSFQASLTLDATTGKISQ